MGVFALSGVQIQDKKGSSVFEKASEPGKMLCGSLMDVIRQVHLARV